MFDGGGGGGGEAMDAFFQCNGDDNHDDATLVGLDYASIHSREQSTTVRWMVPKW